MCSKVLLNYFYMIFRRANLGIIGGVSRIIGSRIGNGWNIVFPKMLHFAFGVIFLEGIKEKKFGDEVFIKMEF